MFHFRIPDIIAGAQVVAIPPIHLSKFKYFFFVLYSSVQKRKENPRTMPANLYVKKHDGLTVDVRRSARISNLSFFFFFFFFLSHFSPFECLRHERRSDFERFWDIHDEDVSPLSIPGRLVRAPSLRIILSVVGRRIGERHARQST